jgi:hypothetical protein
MCPRPINRRLFSLVPGYSGRFAGVRYLQTTRRKRMLCVSLRPCGCKICVGNILSSSTPPKPRFHPNTPTAALRCHNIMGKKKNDQSPEAWSPKAAKEKKPRMRVPLLSDVARMFYEHWHPCTGWRDVQLPGGWSLNIALVPISSMPHSGLEKEEEIECVGTSGRSTSASWAPAAAPPPPRGHQRPLHLHHRPHRHFLYRSPTLSSCLRCPTTTNHILGLGF